MSASATPTARIYCEHSMQDWSIDAATGKRYCQDCETEIVREPSSGYWYRVTPTGPPLQSAEVRYELTLTVHALPSDKPLPERIHATVFRALRELTDERGLAVERMTVRAVDVGGCRCADIQREDPRRHFKGCPLREPLPEAEPAGDTRSDR